MAPSKKQSSLVATSHHKVKFCKPDYDSSIIKMVRTGITTLLQNFSAQPHKSNQIFVRFFSGMYQISARAYHIPESGKELIIDLVSHMDTQVFNSKATFKRYKPTGKVYEEGHHYSYLTQERRLKVRDEFCDFLSHMKSNLLSEHQSQRIVILLGKSFKPTSIPQWVTCKPAMTEQFSCYILFGKIVIVASVLCEEDEYKEHKYAITSAHSDSTFSDIAYAIEQTPKMQGFCIDQPLTQVKYWGRYKEDDGSRIILPPGQHIAENVTLNGMYTYTGTGYNEHVVMLKAHAAPDTIPLM